MHGELVSNLSQRMGLRNGQEPDEHHSESFHGLIFRWLRLSKGCGERLKGVENTTAEDPESNKCNTKVRTRLRYHSYEQKIFEMPHRKLANYFPPWRLGPGECGGS